MLPAFQLRSLLCRLCSQQLDGCHLTEQMIDFFCKRYLIGTVTIVPMRCVRSSWEDMLDGWNL